MKKKAKRLIKDVILNFIIALFWTISLLILFVFAMKNTEYATNDNIEIWLLMFLSVNFMLILLYKLYVENSKVLLTMNLTKSFNIAKLPFVFIGGILLSLIWYWLRTHDAEPSNERRLIEEHNSGDYNNIALALDSSITAPIMEEMLFRGLILFLLAYIIIELNLHKSKIVRFILLPISFCIISSLLFSFAHSHKSVYSYIGYGLSGFVLCLIYLITKNLMFSILLHAMNNITSTVYKEVGNSNDFSDGFVLIKIYAILLCLSLMFIYVPKVFGFLQNKLNKT